MADRDDDDRCPYSMNQVVLCKEDEEAMDRLWALCREGLNDQGPVGEFYRRVHGVLHRLADQHQLMHNNLHDAEARIAQLEARDQALRVMTVAPRGSA